MKEHLASRHEINNRRPTAWRLLKVVAAIGVGLSSLSLIGCVNKAPDVPVPPGFSERVEDYPYEIIIDFGSGESARAYTMERPDLHAEYGQASLTARNVYCPGWNDIREENLGCRNFTEEYRLISPKRIIVDSNPAYAAHHSNTP